MASRAVRDSDFLRQARQNLESTLVRHGYRLSGEEMRLVEGLRRRTAGMSDEQLARALSDGLAGRTPTPQARVGAARARVDRHALEIDGGEGVLRSEGTQNLVVGASPPA